jgi:hypothetical protein
MVIEAVVILSTAVVFWKTIGVVSAFSVHSFDGHPFRFIGMACQWVMFVGGAAATAIGLSVGGIMLLVGIAMMVVSDRRKR